MNFPEMNVADIVTLPITKFREMDYLAIEKYHLPIELMMENAGFNLAQLAASFLPGLGVVIIGVGTGNNGGGGLVAARRLAGWGYQVFLDIPDNNLKELPAIQLQRALSFGAKIQKHNNPDLFIDAYYGFSQRFPLPEIFETAIKEANLFSCLKISLDLPSGFDQQKFTSIFNPDVTLTLAAMKTELLSLISTIRIFVADIGIPVSVYCDFGISFPELFRSCSIVKIIP